MIGGIEPRALEDDPHRRIDLPQALVSAFGAFSQHRVGIFLSLIKLDTAFFAPIRIYRHKNHLDSLLVA